MYDEENFYDEPSEFEMQIEEFKDALMKSVKQEFLDEMKNLREENAKLREREKGKALFDLEKLKKSAAMDARKVRFNRLFEEFMPIVYGVNWDSVKAPKCDKCDENRLIYYTTPLGRRTYEHCDCDKFRLFYKPEVRYVSGIRHDSWGGNDSIIAWHKPDRDDEDITAKVFKSYCDEKRPEDIEKMDLAAFKDLEHCQAYCDWLNEREKEKRI